MANNNNTRSKINTLLNNQKFMALLSVILALFIWMGFTLKEADDITRTVEEVPVVLDTSVPKQNGLTAFGADNLTVDIDVVGARYLVGDNVLSADDFVVTAKANQVNTTGTYTLHVNAQLKDTKENIEIKGLSQDSFDVFFDKEETKQVPLETRVDCEGELLDSEDYMTSDPVPSVEQVTLTGPASQMRNFANAYAEVTTEGGLKKTEKLPAELKVVDKNGAQLKYISCKEKNLTVTIPVLKQVELPLSLNIENIPDNVNPDDILISVNPATVRIAVDVASAKDLQKIDLGTVDYGDLKPGMNTFNFSTEDITQGMTQDSHVNYYVVVTLPEVA